MNNTKLVFVFLLLFVGCFLLFSNKLLTGVTTKVENTITLEKKEEPTRLNTETDLKTTTTTTTTTSTTTTTTTPTTTTSTTTENVIVEKQTELSLIKSISTTPQAEKKPTWILMWRPPWGLTSEGRNEGFKAGDCILTYNRSRIEEAAAVVFHYSGLDKDTMPWQHYRGREQFYVFFSMEAPSYVKHGENRAMDKFDNGFINWTMTYRSDSDVFCPYFESKYAREVFARDEAWLNTTLADEVQSCVMGCE
uniref:uncharacterized protein LOC100180255 n=1 Tax=Ciona intestinalis TaxID=7719 RepID=UPI0002B8EAA8|nr:uncharacterized protein LOC100180255 [Ciona intestinalis]|eukprot:XP_002121663.2 uncharacterized protein LOC100180255 [Ciona intestinalis]